MGLNEVYIQVRSNILIMRPLPFIDSVYNILLSDEKQRQVYFTSQFPSESVSFHAASYTHISKPPPTYKHQYYPPKGM